MMRYLILVLILSCTYAQAQDSRLAENYMDQGEYNKALKIYSKLYEENPRNINVLYKIIDAYHQLEEYNKVDSILDPSRKELRQQHQLLIERGYNSSLQGKDSIAFDYYKKAINIVDSMPNRTYLIARRFEMRNLLDQAIESYKIGMAASPKNNYSVQLANLYGQQGKLSEMFDAYITMIESSPVYRPRAQAIFSRYVTDDAANEGNQLLRKALLLRLRENPDPIYNQLLSWLFVQQKDFKKAFIQEKAIYLRDKESMESLKELAVDAIEEKDDDAAITILTYITEETQATSVRYVAQSLLAKLKADRSLPEEYAVVQQEYESLLNTYGRDGSTFMLQLDYAQFLAFKANQAEKAITLLAQLDKERLSKFQDAKTKMLLADILVLQEQFNRALILYSQIQSDLPNDDLAQTAQYKVARTSYFQGEFDWSYTQLKVLRSATSKLIANDAMQLSLTLNDHMLNDTSFVALKAFSYADLKKYQNKPKEAINLYDQLLLNHKGDPIEDEALLQQAALYSSQGDFEKARANYQLIIDNYSDGILADDAYYQLGLIYQNQLENPAQAQALFERIIYDHADSIYFVDARRRYRRLRGDENIKAF